VKRRKRSKEKDGKKEEGGEDALTKHVSATVTVANAVAAMLVRLSEN